MSAKRPQIEKVSQPPAGAAFLLAKKGPAEGDCKGECTLKWFETVIEARRAGGTASPPMGFNYGRKKCTDFAIRGSRRIGNQMWHKQQTGNGIGNQRQYKQQRCIGIGKERQYKAAKRQRNLQLEGV